VAPTAPVVAPQPAGEPPEAIALRAAEEARLRYETLIAAAKAQQEAAAKTESETDRLKRELEELRNKATIVDSIAQQHARDADQARLSALRRMGLAETLSDANALALAPKVDARDPAGLVELEKWRQANAGLFRASGPSQAQVLERLTPAINNLPKSGLFSADKLLGKLYGGKK
jgi:hypothetical protein